MNPDACQIAPNGHPYAPAAFGPRNSVIAALLGRPYDCLTDTSPWINTSGMYWHELPELWIDHVRDAVGGDE